jgi:RHS repeat-associated protein
MPPSAPEHEQTQHEATGDRTYRGTLLIRAGRVRYEYDLTGRPVLRQVTRLSRKPDTWRYVWNAQNQLVRTTTPDGAVWRYRYDPFGRRIAKERLGADGAVLERVQFTWYETELVEQTADEAGGTPVTVTWNHQDAGPVTQSEHHSGQEETDRRFFAIVTDLVGTPTHLVDEDGRIAWRSRTTLWGAPTGVSSSDSSGTADTPLRFPGQYADAETGWHYNYFRHYDPTTGRYTTQDPLGLLPAPNPHTYPSNPYFWADPLGLAAHPPREFAVNSSGVAESLPVHVIDSTAHAPQANNDLRALQNGAPAILTRRQASEATFRQVRRHAQAHAPRPRRFASNATWEEYPFASTYEGGAGATLTLSPGSVNSSHGNALKQFYQDAGVLDGNRFIVRVG